MAAPKKPTVTRTAKPGPKRARKPNAQKEGPGGRTLLAGAAIGSAAIAAALLFATRTKKAPDAKK